MHLSHLLQLLASYLKQAVVGCLDGVHQTKVAACATPQLVKALPRRSSRAAKLDGAHPVGGLGFGDDIHVAVALLLVRSVVPCALPRGHPVKKVRATR